MHLQWHFIARDLNPDTKVIVLRSAGDKSFCAGASFNELAAITTEEEGLKFFSGFANVINAMRKNTTTDHCADTGVNV